MKILLTGSTGFVGSHLKSLLIKQGFDLRTTTRVIENQNSDNYFVHDINSNTDWSEILKNCDLVIHLAGKAHSLDKSDYSELSSYREINSRATINLAIQASNAGVKRFIFLSTIKVNGGFTKNDRPYAYDDIPRPHDSYSLSKYEAEIGLHKLKKTSPMEIIIIRPPVIYGKNSKGNILKAFNFLNLGIPLPLASFTYNKRSIISITELNRFIIHCINAKNIITGTYMIANKDVLNTFQFFKILASENNTNLNYFRVPVIIIYVILKIMRRVDIFERLNYNLYCDIDYTIKMLEWN